MANAVVTNRVFQERPLNMTYFIARYGLGIVGFMYDRMDCDESAHQIIRLSEMD